MPNPLVSIIICTCNRADDLQQTLVSLADLSVPEELPAELIIVDNASTDNTAEVVKACHIAGLPLRYIFEPTPGKGYAYNRGMAEAKGEIFLFTDDDVRPPRHWIEGMCRPILAGEADAVAGGVHFAPHLERDWMLPRHRALLASTERLNPVHPEDMVGANMAFSRKVLDKVPQFDTALGPGALGFVDDSLFSFQLKEAGYRIAPALGVEVEHHFQQSRLSSKSFLQTAEKMGQSLAYLTYHWGHSEPKYSNLRLFKVKLKLIYWQTKKRLETYNQEGIALEELSLVTSLHFYKYLCSQRKTSRHYSKNGLTKQN